VFYPTEKKKGMSPLVMRPSLIASAELARAAAWTPKVTDKLSGGVEAE
jgi:hypothetical protein